ncbi:MAG: cytochrome-c peroxidase [Kiloniellales bacterium]|nr:cytochrome-c peroxidase [Kiloniellales bacterium]
MKTQSALRGAALLLATLASPALAADPLMEEANELFDPIPLAVPAVKDNPVTREKVELGKMLFFDPRLSASGLLSCNTCHNLGMGGDDNLETSVGHGWAQGPRNAPTVFNAVFNVAQFWDGRAADLKAQAKGPIQAGVEMNSTPGRVIETLASMPEYVTRFERSFPGEAVPLTFDNVAKAIEAFEATLITPASPFDQFLEGNANALNADEKEGLRLFIDKGCAACHNGVNVGGGDYYAFGVVETPGSEILPEEDKGRFAVTETVGDEYVFRAPPLRNVTLTAPYFHSGKVWSLRQAVAVMSSSQLGETLSDQEVEAITAFLETLTGELPVVEYPILPTETPATPKPEPMQP